MGLENTSLAPDDIDGDSEETTVSSPASPIPVELPPQISRALLFDQADFRRVVPIVPKVPAAPAAAKSGSSRRQLFDQADFSGRPALAKEPKPAYGAAAAVPYVATPDAPTPSSPVGYRGDALIAADHLRELGWPREKVAKILRGPKHHCIHEIAGKECEGKALREVPATSLLEVGGSPEEALPPGVRPKGQSLEVGE